VTQNGTEQIATICGQNAEFTDVKRDDKYTSSRHWKFQSYGCSEQLQVDNTTMLMESVKEILPMPEPILPIKGDFTEWRKFPGKKKPEISLPGASACSNQRKRVTMTSEFFIAQ